MLTPRVLGLFVCVLLLWVLCRMRKYSIEWRRHLSLARLAMTRALTLRANLCHSTHRGLCPMCLHHTRPSSRATLLHKLKAWLKMTPTSLSVTMRSWWGSPSRVCSHSCIWGQIARESRSGPRTPHHLPHGRMGETLRGAMLSFASLNSQFSYNFLVLC
jgi:hypothetical protein